MQEPPTELNAFLTRGQAAAVLHVDPKTVSRWALAGKIYSIRTPGGQRRFLESDILALAATERELRQPVGGPPSPSSSPFGHGGQDLHLGRPTPAASTTDEQGAGAVVARAVDVARQAQVVGPGRDDEALRRRSGRAAAAVQRQADLAAITVRDTAARTATTVSSTASTASSGSARQETVLDADALAVTAHSAALATARSTASAAADFAAPVTAAAVVVARTVSDRDAEVEAQVGLAASAVRPAAATTARQVAAEVDSRAVRVADEARRAGADAGRVDDENPAPVVRSPMQLCRELLDATSRLDGPDVSAALDRSLAALGLSRTVQEVLLPSMREVGARWSRGGCDVDQEQVATDCVRSWLEQRSLEAPPSLDEAPIVLACGPLDRHTVGLEAFAVLLRHEQFDCHELGPQITRSALGAAVTSCSAQAVVLVSHLSSNRAAAVSALRAVQDTSATLFYAGAAFRTRATRLRVPGQYLGGNFTDAAGQVRTQLHSTG